MTNDNKTEATKYADNDGQFRRQASKFRNFISSAPGSAFPPARDRYVLYMNYGCPWAHRANMVRVLKHLEEIVPVVALYVELGPDGWFFSPEGKAGSDPVDPLYGAKTLKELYLRADPSYEGRYTVPTLWDKEKQTVVNNESSEIIRMFYTEFDDLIDEKYREEAMGLLPGALRTDIDSMNTWVYDRINNGVYKCGFATNQSVYDEHVHALFQALDRIEQHLGDERWEGPFLYGGNITEADIRLFPTIIRFDVAYVTIFKCNLKTIRGEYPRIHQWLRQLYWGSESGEWNGAFSRTTHFEAIKGGYGKLTGNIVPAGPEKPILPLGA